MAGGKKTVADLSAWLIFEDESGQGLRPSKGRTWGRCGRTPVVKGDRCTQHARILAALIAVKPGPRGQGVAGEEPRITLHFTPTSGSWLNMVEIFFGIITRQAIRRGSFDSVRELTAAIRRFIDGWNDRCEPFTWTKSADEILAHAIRKETS